MIFRKIRARLKEGTWVLFTGTPCQAEALRLYLDQEYDRLIIADLVCYGASSPQIWQKYIRWLERRYGGKIEEYDFRDKRNRDHGHTVSWKMEKKKRHIRCIRIPIIRCTSIIIRYVRPVFSARFVRRRETVILRLGILGS